MELTIAGGCGEHGRNCFYFSNGYHGIIVDCGLKAGDTDCYPHLTPSQIHHASHLLLTHSHGDHSGALAWLLQQGFQGAIVLTTPTLEQLNCERITNKIILLDETTAPLQSLMLTEYLSVIWGRSGHCAGGCWYKIVYEDKTILCSGDYVHGSLCYSCDEISGHNADLAILDAAYSPCTLTGKEMRSTFVSKAAELLARRSILLLPVPKYGRGLEMLLALKPLLRTYQVYGDKHFLSQLHKLYTNAGWLLPDALRHLQNTTVESFDYTASLLPGIYFISDPQLKRPENFQLVRKLSHTGYALSSGHLEPMSNGQTLAGQGLLQQCPYPIHGNDEQLLSLKERNSFNIVIANHSPNLVYPEKIGF